MQTLKNLLSDALKWVFVSSQDPNKVSLTVKMALLGAVPFIMQAVHLACGWALVCLVVDGSVLETVALTVSNLVYLGLSLISGFGFLYALSRKIFRTAAGTNAAFAGPRMVQ